jgi:hypothetical protein
VVWSTCRCRGRATSSNGDPDECKGLDNVRAEFSLTALVYNLRRALNILGVETMMAAVRG